MSRELTDLDLYRDERERLQLRRERSRYAQLRLTVTFGPGGRADYRAMTKAPHEAWDETRVFAVGHEKFGQYPPDFAAALEYFESVASRMRWLPSER